MARIVKTNKPQKRRGKINFFNLSIVILSICSFVYLMSALFLRTYNNSLTSEIQETQKEISLLEMQNESINLEIARLASMDGVDEIASNNGLSRNTDNIIRIEVEESSGEGENE